MKKLIQKEPITPFTDRVQELSAMGISTILVIGGSGEYLAVADQVFMMDEFLMSDVTAYAKELAPLQELAHAGELVNTNPLCSTVSTSNGPAQTKDALQITHTNWDNNRTMIGCFCAYPKGTSREMLKVSDTGFIVIGDERIDIRYLHDIATDGHVNALAFMLRYLAKGNEGVDSLESMALALRGLSPKGKPDRNKTDIIAKVHELFSKIEIMGINLVDTSFFTGMNRFMDMPRYLDLMAAINRMRHVQWHKN